METYLGTILLVPYDFVPSGWAACDGASLQVSQYQALYSLLGNRFGGTAPQTFALPNRAESVAYLEFMELPLELTCGSCAGRSRRS